MRWFVAVLLCCGLSAQHGEAVLSGMQRMSAAIADLERALAAEDRPAVDRPAREIESTVKLLRDELHDTFGANEVLSHLDQLATASGHLRRPNDTEPWKIAQWDLRTVRAACIGCHLQFRTGNDERGNYPARGNTLFGTLRVEGGDGEARQDRSGAVVFVEGEGLGVAPLPRPPVISQRGRSFHPAVMAVTRGTTVRFPNDDVVFHNVFSLSRGNTFDLGVYGKGVQKERVFEAAGLVKVHCNIHPDMAAHILVLNNDAAAVTGPSGFWSIPDLPDGEYTVRVWHPLGGPVHKKVELRLDATTNIDLAVRETKLRVQHPNKHGRPYREKY